MIGKIAKRVLALGATTAAALSGTFTAPAPAEAHCGDHAYSCGYAYEYVSDYCTSWPGDYYVVYNAYLRNCSGTCYNNNTQGCCDSPAACNDAPCKPGGCGSACQYSHTVEQFSGYCG